MDESAVIDLIGKGSFAGALLFLLYVVGMRIVRALDRLTESTQDIYDDVSDLRAHFFSANDLTPVDAPSLRKRARTPRGGVRPPTAIDRPWERDRK